MASSVKIAPLSHKADKDGLCPIAIRITVNRKIRYIYIGHKVALKDWSDRDGGKVKSSVPGHQLVNALIARKRSEVSDEMIKTELMRSNFTSAQVKNTLQHGRISNNFFALAQIHLAELEKSKKISRMWSERPRIKHFQKFVEQTTGSSSISFQEITESLLKKFIAYLKGDREVSERTVMNYLVVIRTLYNRAIQEGLADRRFYPFGKGKIRIQMPESMKIGLTEDEVKMIERLELHAGSGIWHARNVWLISFYFAGIRNGDVLKLKWQDLKDDRLYYTMGKNRKVLSVKVPDKTSAIFDEYRIDSDGKDDHIFPELKTAIFNNPQSIYRKTLTASKKFNRYMAQVAKLCGIERKITTHIARHTFGNISGDKISPQMLQKLYRHSDICTTMGYQANFIFREADDALDSVINF